MLRDLNLLRVYQNPKYDIIQELQIPLLKNSISYLRGVGYFTSGWLRLAAKGINIFAEAGGHIRFIVSPNLELSDLEAIEKGEQAKSDYLLYEVLRKGINDIEINLESDIKNILAWMVADSILEFRFAFPRNKKSTGMYHDKVGIFTDSAGDIVVTHGSFNDTIHASYNCESISVFVSWEPVLEDFVHDHFNNLQRLWNNMDPNFKSMLIPEAIKEKLISLKTTDDRPYCINNSKKNNQFASGNTLRPYQDEAINNWFENNCCGIFEMATGTGKTITALSAANKLFENKKRLILIIIIPYLHLLEQWKENCELYGFSPLLCSGENKKWRIEFPNLIRDFNLGIYDKLCIIAVHQTASMDNFQTACKILPSEYTMLIGDEVHGLGAPKLQKALIYKALYRLGLSATPNRWYDEDGTQIITNYFSKVCFEYTLDDAIKNGFLTEYKYYPEMISLNNDESSEYEIFTNQIVNLLRIKKRSEVEEKKLKILSLKRAQIISAASSKLPHLIKLIKNISMNLDSKGEKFNGILIYCAPGTHKEVLKAVSELGFSCHEFVHDVSLKERELLLKQFALGDIQILVAIKCLDEGVDVPSTRIAFILASTTNPKEFVQRRGRILRKAEGKGMAEVIDFIVVPEENRRSLRLSIDESILRREMPRFAEFSASAINKYEARNRISGILNNYGLLHLLDKKPWDVYHELKEIDWEE